MAGGEVMEMDSTSFNNNRKTDGQKQQDCLKVRKQHQQLKDRLLPILPKPAVRQSSKQRRVGLATQSGPLFIREPIQESSLDVRSSTNTTSQRHTSFFSAPRNNSTFTTSTSTMNYFGHLFFEPTDWSPLCGGADPQQQPQRFTFDQTGLPSTSTYFNNFFNSPASTPALVTPHFNNASAAEKFFFSSPPLPATNLSSSAAAASFFFPPTTPSASRMATDGMCEAFLPPPPSALAAVFPPPAQALTAQPSTSIENISTFHFNNNNNNNIQQSHSERSRRSGNDCPHNALVIRRSEESFNVMNLKQECSSSWAEPTNNNSTEGTSTATAASSLLQAFRRVKVEEPEAASAPSLSVLIPQTTTVVTIATSLTTNATTHPSSTNGTAGTSLISVPSTSSSSSSTIVPISASSLICDRFSPSSISCASIDSGCFCESSFPPASPDSTSCSSTSSVCSRVGNAAAVSMVAALLKSTALQSASHAAEVSTVDLSLHRSAATFTALIAWPTTKTLVAASATVCAPNLRTVAEAVASKRKFQNAEPTALADDDEDDVPLPKIAKLEPIDVDLDADDLEMPKLEREEPIKVVSLSDFVQNSKAKPLAKEMPTTENVPVKEVLPSMESIPAKEACPREDVSAKKELVNEVKWEETTTAPPSATDDCLLICECFWATCERRFPNDNGLYDHVVETHLEKVRPIESSTAAVASTSRQTRSAARRNSNQSSTKTAAGGGSDVSSLACQWDGCTMSLQRGSAQKQFDWLMNHFTTRHAPRAQPFSCLFADCHLRFRTRQSLSDHLRSQHDDLRGRNNRNGNGAAGLNSLKSFGFRPNVQILPNLDLMDRRTCFWIHHVLQEREIVEKQQQQQRLLSRDSVPSAMNRRPLAARGSLVASPLARKKCAQQQKATPKKSVDLSIDVDENRCDDVADGRVVSGPSVAKRLEASKTRALLCRLFKLSNSGGMKSPVHGIVAMSARKATTFNVGTTAHNCHK